MNPISQGIAAFYLRVSTESQDDHGSSLETQQAACEQYCTDHGLTPEFILRETWSGLALDRPQLNQLREFARSQRIDAVVVYATDRLSRDPVHLLLLLEEWDKLGVKTHFITEPRDDTLEGQLITFVRGWTGKVEAVKIAERTQRGRRERAKSGRLPTGAQRYGWTYIPETGKREINENEAQIIRDMATWVIKDALSWGAIRARLHEQGIPAPEGGEWWGLSTIRRILMDRALIGESYGYRYVCVEPKNGSRPGRRYCKTRREERPRDEWLTLLDATPSILSRDEFDGLQRQLQRSRSLVSRAQKYQYLLAGFLHCGSCGARYYGEPGRGKRYYRCAGRRAVPNDARCRNPMMDADGLELLITSWFDSVWTDSNYFRLALLRLYQPKNDRAPLEAKIKEVEGRLDKLNGEERRLVHCYVRGDFYQKILESEKSRINSERARLVQERDSLSLALAEWGKFQLDLAALEKLRQLTANRWTSMSFTERRQLFDHLRLRLEVMPDRSVKYSGLLPVPDVTEKQVREEFPQYVGAVDQQR